MTDTLTKSQRFICMSRNTGTNTNTEMLVRHLIYSLGYRYRLHRRDLPGCPDMVFPSYRKVIFVNGCYWHRHKCKKGRSFPETRKQFWNSKFERTKQRDKENQKKLKKLGWKVLIIWECRIKNPDKLKTQIIDFLGS